MTELTPQYLTANGRKPYTTKIRDRRQLFEAWLALSRLIEYYDTRFRNGICKTETEVQQRAATIAAFRAVEQEIGVAQSIPRRVR